MKLNPVFKNEIKLSSRTMKSSWMVFGYNAVLIVASMMVLYSMMDTVHVRLQPWIIPRWSAFTW